MMTLGIRYLRGVAVANDLPLQRPEWPPHPGRVFMALAAAHFETGEDADEKRALEWLERQQAPAISASEAFDRSPVEAYVPTNDKNGWIVGRGKQSRVFQTLRPERDSVFLVYPSGASDEVRKALERLCGKVTRMGHSSSLVQMWLASSEEVERANWTPASVEGTLRMRVANEGTLEALNQAFEQKVRPALHVWQGYAKGQGLEEEREEEAVGPFDARPIVFNKYEGNAIGLETTLQLTGALRNAAMAAVKDNIPEWLSGHQTDGTPSLQPHAAFFPLPFVEAAYADGHLMGVAMAIPRQVPEAERRRVIQSLLFDNSGAERQLELWSTAWKWKVEREKRARLPETLAISTWTRASRTWASVTPVVLHHYPKKNRDVDIERIVREAFASALLPDPIAIEIRPVSWFRGAGHAKSMPEYDEGGAKLCRYQVHVVAQFARKLHGPLLVGRGRFRGYGLFRPMEDTSYERS